MRLLKTIFYVVLVSEAAFAASVSDLAKKSLEGKHSNGWYPTLTPFSSYSVVTNLDASGKTDKVVFLQETKFAGYAFKIYQVPDLDAPTLITSHRAFNYATYWQATNVCKELTENAKLTWADGTKVTFLLPSLGQMQRLYWNLGVQGTLIDYEKRHPKKWYNSSAHYKLQHSTTDIFLMTNEIVRDSRYMMKYQGKYARTYNLLTNKTNYLTSEKKGSFRCIAVK